MTVKEVLKMSATTLDFLQEYEEGLTGASLEGQEKVNLLLHAFNLVENELALNYFPLTYEEVWETGVGTILFSKFQKKVIRILKVQDALGNDVDFSLFPTYLKTQPGKVVVRYNYQPKEKKITDSCEFELYVSARLMSYGINSAFCLASGLFEEANVWEKKYKQAIESAYKSAPCKRIRARRWV